MSPTPLQITLNWVILNDVSARQLRLIILFYFWFKNMEKVIQLFRKLQIAIIH